MTTQARASTRSTHLTRLPARRVTPNASHDLFTTVEVFGWVCDKQGVKAHSLSDARYYCLFKIADTTADKLNALFGYTLT